MIIFFLNFIFDSSLKDDLPILRELGKAVLANPCPVCASDKTKVFPGSKTKAVDLLLTGSSQVTDDDVFACPGCGFPSHCSHVCYHRDHHHLNHVCEDLVRLREDEHLLRKTPPGPVYLEIDERLRAGPRTMPPSEGAGRTGGARTLSSKLRGWAEYVTARGLLRGDEMESEHLLRFVSTSLTYPMTVAKFLPTLVPNVRNITDRPVTIMVVGARGEAVLPLYLWREMALCFPGVGFDIIHIGPEVPEPLHGRRDTLDSIRVAWVHSKLEESGPALAQLDADASPDIFFVPHSGIGLPSGAAAWAEAFRLIAESGVPTLFTSFDSIDLADDLHMVKELLAGHNILPQTQWVIKPSENPYRSFKPAVANGDITRILHANHSVFAIKAVFDNETGAVEGAPTKPTQ